MLENATRICEAKFGNLFARWRRVPYRRRAASVRPPALRRVHAQARAHSRRAARPLRPHGRDKQVVHIADIRAEQAISIEIRSLSPLSNWRVRTLLSCPMLKENELIGASHLSSGGPSVHRQADRAGAELRRPGRHRHREHAAAQRTARQICCSSRPPPPTCSRSSAARLSICRPCSTRLSSRPPDCAMPTWRQFPGRRATSSTSSRPTVFRTNLPRSCEDASDARGAGFGVGRACLEGRTVHIPDVLADPEYTLAERRSSAGFRTMLGVPLMREGMPHRRDRLARGRRASRSPTSRSSWSPPSPTKR